ncbi:hypothetical protein [Neorhizobium galegae]|uniref:hypothetical protein n=1 Tax=Neorhizobium galegae TaxID=399 RepID=UPI00210686D9|nr:hypothetical protein [Neorhizobium galegae]MCQ1839096.1 hypothetical protein [Neorhizobium galegae]UIY31471.1 hypothetical protein LZK73_30870 [Neorhizobium galegae]
MAIQDITKSDSVENAHEDDRGTGIYWFTVPSGGEEQIFVPDITRAKANEIARHVDALGGAQAYRWVPENTMDAAQLIQSKCGGRCQTNVECVNPACRCYNGRCQRKR